MDRPHIVCAWLHELLVRRKAEGGLAVESPILTRVYQVCVRGLRQNACDRCYAARRRGAWPF